ncbi:hypothetical protein ACJIZ3_024614 [Penstemon smallii]|uniref:DUF630 domain-containing protein n=1 Tax=Penstemon smallii TaxID=265156 RepID=A0ABD3TUH9_9LAMI
MGCSGSKAEDLPLVVRCRERRELIRAAANHRYALAAAHVSYFRSLKDVGDALRKFVDEELITTTSPSHSSSSFSSPSLILPPNSKAKSKHSNADESSFHLHDDDEDEDESHLDISDSSSEDDHTHHQHQGNKGFNNEEEQFSSIPPNPYPGGGFNGYGQGYGGGLVNDPYMYPYPYPPSYPSYGEQYMDPWYQTGNSNVYYMKKSAPATRTVIQEPPPDPSYGYSDSYWTSPVGYGTGGNYGYFPVEGNGGVKVRQQKEAPPPPSPKASTWDFFNPFDVFDGGYTGGYYSSAGNGYGSETGSPDSSEVREREGIPDLEEETENEAYKEVLHGKRMKARRQKSSGETGHGDREGGSKSVPLHKSEGNSRSVPLHKSEGNSRTVPLYKSEDSSRSVSLHTSDSSSRSLPSWTSSESEKPSIPPQFNNTTAKPSMPPHYSEEGMKPSMPPPQSKGTSWVVHSSNGEMDGSVNLTDEKSSSENIVSTNVDESSVKKKGVTFEVEGTSKQDGDSSILSSVTLLSPHGNRDLREVVAEIRDEFETASGYGKEVAIMLEVGKMPYQPSFLKVIISRILYLISPSMSLMDPPSLQSAKLASRTMKSAKSYFEDVGKDVNVKACNLSSTLDKLYAWEMKLYKEVKVK